MDRFGRALEKNVSDLTVMDVYDIAAVVGQDFERIIDQYGCEALTRLMPKVVRVLEILEILVSRNTINTETEELQLELERLRLERRERLEKEKIREQELELVEDVWRGETQELLSQISELQAQNRTLRMSLALKDSPATDEELQQQQEGVSENEKKVMRKLKEVVDQQREQIKTKDRELNLKNEDVEALQLQQHRLMKINQDLRHRVCVVEAQGKALIQQRAELEARAQARQQELGTLRRAVARAREDQPQDQPQEQPEEQPQESQASGSPAEPAGEASASEMPVIPTAETTTEALCEDDSGEEESCSPDPNRPRFTLQELRDVLQEKNELKAQVFMLQEELAYYKSEEEQEEQMVLLPPAPSLPPRPPSRDQPDSGIKRLIFTAVMPMVAAGLLSDDPTLQPIRRLISFV